MERSTGTLARVTINLAALCIFIVGAIFKVDQMFLMALALALLSPAAWIVGWLFSGGVVCSRSLPALCGVGETVPVTLTLTNAARLSRPALHVSDVLPRGLKVVPPVAGLVSGLRPGEEQRLTYLLEAARRGRYRLSMTRMDSADPLGFYLFSRQCSVVSDLAVYPRILPLRRVFWEEKAAQGGQSLETAQRRGTGLEFHGVRDYQPGDELRHVHWRTTARTGRLAVMEYAQGADLSATVVLDLSRAAYQRLGTGKEAALDCAVTVAASVCAFLLRRGISVHFLAADNVNNPALPAGGNAALFDILERLVGAEADSDLPLSAVLFRAGALHDSLGMLVCITPENQSEMSELLAGEGMFGERVIGLQVATAEHPASSPPSLFWRSFAPGDDLIALLEGN